MVKCSVIHCKNEAQALVEIEGFLYHQCLTHASGKKIIKKQGEEDGI